MITGAKYDDGKLDLTTVPPEAIEMIAQVRAFGLKKYAEAEDWQKVEVDKWDKAMYRHFIAYLKDPYHIDEESGLPAYMHVLTNAAFIACAREKVRDVQMRIDGYDIV